MKYLIQHSYNQKILIKIIINITVLLTFYNQTKQLSIANTQNNHTIQQTPTIHHQINTKKINDKIIKIQSDQASFYLTETVTHFSGNVTISFNKNVLYADEIYLYKKTNHNTQTQIFLSGFGNINYNNNITHITGGKIIANIQNKNIDLYQGNFSFSKQKTTYGSADHIKQRKNNRYTILKNANFSTCPPHKKYWNISGSQILYDHKNDNLNIWNAYFKIKKIPILFIPYIQLSLPYKNIPEHHPPIPQYNHTRGTEIKLPYHFNINNNIHGKITTNFTSKKNIQVQNYIQYYNNLNTGSIHLNLLNNHIHRKNSWLLYFYNDSYIQKKLHIKNEYIKISNHNNFYNEKSKYTYIVDNYYIKKNMLWKYDDNIWNINLFHKEFKTLNQYIQNIYNTKPQININYHIKKFTPFHYKIFGQITHFKNINYNYPKTIRLHIEPSINISSNILHTNFNTEIKLKNTYYQQKNIDFYNKTINNMKKNIYLKKSVNRFLPEFKSNAKLILHKKTNVHSKHKLILEPKIQYLYIPYRNQNNIGLYDTTIIETTEHTNLFQDIIYSGLDRISSANQLTSNINTKIYDKNDIKLLFISLGQTYYFTPQRIDGHIAKNPIHKNNKNNLILGTNTYLKINQSIGIRTNFQYNTKIKKLKSGNTIVEYHTKNNKMLQMNFRYLNSQYFSQITPEETNPIYKKNITQIGIIGNWPINKYWTFRGTQFYNIKSKHTINQNIRIQYHTCCWKINTEYERKIHSTKEKINVKKYDNKLSFNLTLSGIKNNLQPQSKTCNTLNTNTTSTNKN